MPGVSCDQIVSARSLSAFQQAIVRVVFADDDGSTRFDKGAHSPDHLQGSSDALWTQIEARAVQNLFVFRHYGP